MSISLTDQSVATTYGQLLHVDSGIDSSKKRIYDGDGTGSPLWIGSNTLEMTDKVIISGTLNLQEKSSLPSNPTSGDLAFVNGDLYIAI